MKVRAPFYVQAIEGQDPAQATSTAWYLYGFGQHRTRVYDRLTPWKTRTATLWGYWRQSYLGSMLLTLPSQTYTWRQS